MNKKELPPEMYQIMNLYTGNHMYGKIFYDKDLYFHGTVKLNISNLSQILAEGVLSLGEANKRGIKTIENEPFYNGRWKVSVCMSPSIHSTFERVPHAAFPEYIRGRMSFIIKNPANIIPQSPFNTYNPDMIDLEGHSGYIDEIFIGNSVKPEHVVGIIVPRDWLTRKASEYGVENVGNMLVKQFLEENANGLPIYDENGLMIIDFKSL